MVRGANTPLLTKIVKDQMELEKAGQPHVQFMDTDGTPLLAPMAGPSYTSGGATAGVSANNLADGASRGLEEETFALIKPDAMAIPSTQGQILDTIKRHGFNIVKARKVWLNVEQANEFYAEHVTQPFYPKLIAYMTSRPILALVLSKENAVKAWRELAGPTNPRRAKEEAPQSIRGTFGIDGQRNAVHGADSPERAQREKEIVFASSVVELPLSADFLSSIGSRANNTHVQKTLVVIHPEIVAQGKTEEIIERFHNSNYDVVRSESVTITKDQAEEMYKSLKETHSAEVFESAVASMTSGNALAVVLRGEDVVNGVLEMVGPEDPAVAQQQVPSSVRAIYGKSLGMNGVYASVDVDSAARDTGYILPRASSARALHASAMGIHRGPGIERTCAIIKPDAYGANKKDEILAKIKATGFTIVKEQEVTWTKERAGEFYAEHKQKPFFDALTDFMSSGPIYVMVLEREAGITGWRELAGPTNSDRAREIAPTSIRALFGKDSSANAVHGSDSPLSAEREISLLFGKEHAHPSPSSGQSTHGLQRTGSAAMSKTLSATNIVDSGVKKSTPEIVVTSGSAKDLSNKSKSKSKSQLSLNGGGKQEKTLALIKPDAYGANKKSDIVAKITEAGFKVVAEKEFTMTLDMAKEFYAEHKERPFFDELTSWMSSAPIYAMVLTKEGGVKGWRELMGPTNSEKARETAPQSLRALFGKDGSQNALHGSDSIESAQREMKLVFGEDVVKGL